jgi:CysZ protein
MPDILRAYASAVRSLRERSVRRHFLWPILAAAVLWLGAGLAFWDRLARALTSLVRQVGPMGSLLTPGQGAEAAVVQSLKVVLYLVSVPLAMVTAVLLLEIVALPFILDRVATLDYAALERRHGGSQWQSLRNTARSFAVAGVVAVLTLPAWLLPGAGVAISLLLSTWVNYRSFRYDVLMNHADPQELRALPAAHRTQLFVVALAAGLLGLVPVVNLLAVPLAGLAFAHYLLRALERSRSGRAG